MRPEMPTYTESCGVIHVHTRFSDGGVDFSQLIHTAARVGLDFVVVNDHMTLQGKTEGYEGFSNGLMVIVGYEHQDSRNQNHYLAIGIDRVVDEMESPQRYIDMVRKLGGIGFLAHPLERRHYFKQYPPYPWTDWSVTGFDGIEIWNQMSEWVEKLKRWSNFYHVFYPRRLLRCITPELVQKWDECNRTRFVSGVGGVDAHTWKIRRGPFTLTLFPIKVELKGIRTHIYLPRKPSTDDWAGSKKMLLEGMRDGRGFVSNYRRGDAKGTRIFIELPSGNIVLPGKPNKPYMPPAILHVHAPARCEIRLVRNGALVQSTAGRHAAFTVTETGVYRVELYAGSMAWVYSNPFPVGVYPL